MITFTVQKSGESYLGYEVSGHADYAENGSDIICAAVSVLAETTANSIEEFTDDPFQQEVSDEGGFLSMKFPEGLHEKASLLMDSMILGIKGIQNTYGEKYITLEIEEVKKC